MDSLEEETRLMSGSTYYIKNKDTILGVFQWEVKSGINTPVLVEDLGLPVFVSRNLDFWVRTRRPPKHRKHVEELLHACGLTSTRDIIDASLGLSLTDCLWITKDTDQAWATVNLFENVFNETIAEVAFTGGGCPQLPGSPSPEFSTAGMLPKCWVREGKNIYLKKTGRGKAIYAEVLASQVCEALGVPHVGYRLDRLYGELCCSCELLTSPDMMMVPSYLYYDYGSLKELHALLERDSLIRDYGRMLLADYIIKNTDRHPGNIGVLLGSDTFEVIGLSPLYDNGQSFFFPGPPAMYDSWGEQLAVLRSINPEVIPALPDFCFDSGGVPTEYIDKAYIVLSNSLAEIC